MTAHADTTVDLDPLPEHYLVNHGKSGGLGCFIATVPCLLERGERVLVTGPRGQEVGTIVGPANARQSRLLGSHTAGSILRALCPDDETRLTQLRTLEQQLFDSARRLVRDRNLPVEILDVDVLLGDRAILQYLGRDDVPLDDLAKCLGQDFRLDIRLENLASSEPIVEPPAESHGCGKPDCGKTAGGSCSTCSTGGGCSSCGSGATDIRPYFAHLRTQMEAKHRTPLL